MLVQEKIKILKFMRSRKAKIRPKQSLPFIFFFKNELKNILYKLYIMVILRYVHIYYESMN